MGILQQLRDKGIERGYRRHIVALEPVLQQMSNRGMPVDPTRFAEVDAILSAAIEKSKGEMQALVPIEAKRLKQYKKTPKNLQDCFQKDGIWFRVLPWSPSNKGLLNYIRFKGHPVPKQFKTGKDTTAALEIARLAKSMGDPLYTKVLEYRKVATLKDNFIENWRPGPDDRVHTTFYYTATGQLSSRHPNVQNMPKHGAWAKVFRSVVKAPSGHTLIEFDYKSFHVQTLAFEAQDADLMRIGRLDLHSFVTSDFLKLKRTDVLFAMQDDELRDYLAWVKKNYKEVRDAKVKHAILGYNNGMGWKKLFAFYREFFDSEREAKQVHAMMDSIFTKAKDYRKRICDVAHDQGFLISRHGFIRYFWEVYRWQGGKWSHGDDYEAALSFFTQNDAHGELKDRILQIAEQGLDEKYGLIDTVHDSLIFCCPDNLVDECRKIIHTIMVAPSKVLIDPVVAPNGLSVEVDIQGGPDWASMRGL